MSDALTRRACNRATLARQLLLARAPLDVEDAVRRVVAIQAQEPASIHLALRARVADVTPAAVDAALAARSVVRATLMRITLHAVHADDHATLHAAMQPTLRAARLNDRRFRDTGTSIEEADAALAALLDWATEPRTNAEAEAWLAARGLDDPMVWWALRQYGPLLRSVSDEATWAFSSSVATYEAAPTPPPPPGDHQHADEALRQLVRRYLAGFGPATLHDIGQFGLLPLRRLRPVVAAMADELVELVGPDGVQLLDVPGGELPAEDVVAPPRLLPMWDSVLFAYADRTRIIDDDVRAQVIRRNGDTLPSVLVDGRVVGVWRPAPDGAGIEVTTLRTLDDAAWAGLAAEAADVLAFVGDRDPALYARHRRWWDRLDGVVTTRVLAP